ncbi:thiol-disulfide isomerase/thioredoxin [Pedobacter africanus]|uniref:Thiol-disulfide isomerase/thioredoxin n=1 Tax=Pedobacter africanus TaxID=151894 RepID=A0ACC6KZ95_9SPHI|nr:TlpA disulfide reductase family protein [Pedobacter africanus]MDR6784551.1 thiol-disulfide isomerase/thioredoxin [Pedobacter africanus]
MKKISALIAILFIGSSGYSQQMQPVYKASLDSLKIFIDPSKKETILNRLVKAYPGDNFDQYRAALIDNFVIAKNSAKALFYFNQIEETARVMYVGSVATGLMAYDLKAAETLIRQELANPTNVKEDRLFLLNLYSQLMDKKGDYHKAFAAIKECYEQAPRKSVGLTAQYYYLMSKTGRYQEAFPELEKAASTGLVDDNFKAELKNAYAKVNPGKDANAYLTDLSNQFEEKYSTEIAAKMIAEQAPEFKVEDVNGREVSLSDFKGKTIVLDFWATWCGPCKKSLPAMQMMVNKYVNDPNVNFLFIHTWETVPDPKSDAVNYLLTHNLDLPLYMDVKNPETKKNPAVSSFGVKGIPAKFIIDGNGKIRFKTSGLVWPNEAAVKELSAMVEMARKM